MSAGSPPSAAPTVGYGQGLGHGLPAAVLWDLDGTIVDTEPYWMAAERELVDRFDGQWNDADARSIVGFDLIDSANVLRSRGGVDLDPQRIVAELSEAVITRMRERMPWRPGARELLAELGRQGVPCALVTMSWKPLADEVIAQLPSGTFAAVVTGDMVLNGKPHPEPYRRAASELGVDALSCVAIEDSPPGVASAEAAGCVVVAVPNVVAIPDAEHRIRLQSLVGVSPQLLGEWVETTPPPPPGRITGDDDRADDGRWTPRPRWQWLTAAVVALAVLAVGIWWFALRDADERYEPGAFNVNAWVPYWELDESLPAFEANVNAFHVVSPFWHAATGAATIAVSEEADPELTARFVAVAAERGVPVVPTITDGTDTGGMAAILADPIQRAAHVESLATFAAQGGYAGVDIDYEGFAFSDPRSTWATTQPNWVAFVTELGARLHADGRQLYVSVPVVGREEGSEYSVYDIGAIAPHVDGIRLMMYDYSTDEAGPIAPLEWVERGIATATEQAGGPEKLILGIPVYGRNWVVSTDRPCPEDAVDTQTVQLDFAAELMTRRSAAAVRDETTGESSFQYDLAVPDTGTAECVQRRQVNFLDEQGIRQRMQLSIDRGMMGVSLWALGFESSAVYTDVAAINATLDTTVPDGSAATTVAATTTVAPATAAPTTVVVTAPATAVAATAAPVTAAPTAAAPATAAPG